MEATTLKVLWEVNVLSRFIKLQGKTTIVEFEFSKVVG